MGTRCVRKVAPRSFDIDVGGISYRHNQRHMRLSSKDNLASSHDMADGSGSLEETTVLNTVSGAKPTPPKDEVRDEEPMLPRRSSRIPTAPDRYGFPSLGRIEDVALVVCCRKY